MTSFEPQVGDIVKYEGKVARVYDNGSFELEDGGYIGMDCGGISLVERPEATVTIELTEQQAKNIAAAGEWMGLDASVHEAVRIIRKALNERS